MEYMRKLVGIVALLPALVFAEISLKETSLAFKDSNDLAQQLAEIATTYGEDKARRVVENMGFFVAHYVDDATGGRIDPGLEYQQQIGILENYQAEAMAALDGWTYEELEAHTYPLRLAFYQVRSEKAHKRVSELEVEKATLENLATLKSQLRAEPARIQVKKDEFGYRGVELKFRLTNTSPETLTHFEFQVPSSLNGLFLISAASDPVGPGSTREFSYAVAPTHPSVPRWLNRDGDSLKIAIAGVRTLEGEGIDLTKMWTEEMQQTLEELRRYANYEESTE